MHIFDSSLQSGIFPDNEKQLVSHPYSKLEKKINLQIINQYSYSHASQSSTKE